MGSTEGFLIANGSSPLRGKRVFCAVALIAFLLVAGILIDFILNGVRFTFPPHLLVLRVFLVSWRIGHKLSSVFGILPRFGEICVVVIDDRAFIAMSDLSRHRRVGCLVTAVLFDRALSTEFVISGRFGHCLRIEMMVVREHTVAFRPGT